MTTRSTQNQARCLILYFLHSRGNSRLCSVPEQDLRLGWQCEGGKSMLVVNSFLSYLYLCILYNCPNGIFPVGHSGRFPQGNPAATESRYPSLINYKLHAESFRVSIIHRTMTWTKGSLTCVRNHCECVHTRGLGTPIASQHNIFDSNNSQMSVVLQAGLEPRSFGSRVRRSTH